MARSAKAVGALALLLHRSTAFLTMKARVTPKPSYYRRGVELEAPARAEIKAAGFTAPTVLEAVDAAAAAIKQPSIAVLKFDAQSIDDADLIGADIIKRNPSLRVVLGYSADGAATGVSATLLQLDDISFQTFHLNERVNQEAVTKSPTFWQSLFGKTEQSSLVVFPSASFVNNGLNSLLSSIEKVLPGAASVADVVANRSFVTVANADASGNTQTNLRSGGVTGIIFSADVASQLQSIWQPQG